MVLDTVDPDEKKLILKGMRIILKQKIRIYSIILSDCEDQATRDFFLEFTGDAQ